MWLAARKMMFWGLGTARLHRMSTSVLAIRVANGLRTPNGAQRERAPRAAALRARFFCVFVGAVSILGFLGP